MFGDLIVVLACAFPEFLLDNFCSLFVPSQHLCVMFVRKIQLQEELKDSVYIISV